MINAKTVLIGSFVLLGIFYILVYLFMLRFLRQKRADGTRAIDDAVNEQTKTGKPTIEEILIYGSLIVIGGFLIYNLVHEGGVNVGLIGRLIAIPIATSIFNARRRTGRSMMAIMAAFLAALYLMLLYFMIGLPPKAPSLVVDQTPIVMNQTSAEDLHREGYEVYLRREEAGYAKYDDYLSSGDYQRYSWDRSRKVIKGFESRNIDSGYPPYILVKDGHVIGNLILYAGQKEDKLIEDSKVIGFGIEEQGSQVNRERGTKVTLEGIDLMKPLDSMEISHIFKKKLWLRPTNGSKADVTSLVYGIHWNSRSDHVFWDGFYSYIRFDENDLMTSFELLTDPVRDYQH